MVGVLKSERQMTAVQREHPLRLTWQLEDICRLGPAPDQKAPAAAIVHLHPAQGRECACTIPRKPTH